MSRFGKIAAQADDLIQAGELDKARQIANDLSSIDEHEAVALSVTIRACIVDASARFDSVEMDAAIDDLRALLARFPSADATRLLARLLMKRGPGDFSEAYLLLTRLPKKDKNGAVMLGLAHYFRNKPKPELELARAHYLAAARRGRTRGLVGANEISIELKQFYPTVFGFLALLICAPLFRLFLGRKSGEIY